MAGRDRQTGNAAPPSPLTTPVVTFRRLMVTVVSALALSCACSSLAANYYRWHDANGRLVISDRPPADRSINYETISGGTALRTPRNAPASAQPPAEPSPPPASEPVEPAATPPTPSPRDARSCSMARANLQTLETSPRIRINDPATGELRYLSDEERAAQMEEAKKLIERFCD